MVKEITYFKCTVCGREYKDRKRAEECFHGHSDVWKGMKLVVRNDGTASFMSLEQYMIEDKFPDRESPGPLYTDIDIDEGVLSCYVAWVPSTDKDDEAVRYLLWYYVLQQLAAWDARMKGVNYD